MDDGGALVAGAGGQVAQGADQVGQAAGSGALGGHGAGQVALLADLFLDGGLQSVAGQVGEIVVSQVLIGWKFIPTAERFSLMLY